MSDNPETPTPDPTPTPHGQEPTPPANPTPEVPAQDSTDWKAEARKWESLAKKNKDAAERLAQIEEASKTEAQKQSEALASALARVKEYETREQIATWKDEVAKSIEGVPDEMRQQLRAVLAGSTEEEIQAHAESLKSLFVNAPLERPRPGAVPTIGRQPAGAPNIPLSEQIAHAESERDQATPGTEPWKIANERVMGLKGEQLFAAARLAN